MTVSKAIIILLCFFIMSIGLIAYFFALPMMITACLYASVLLPTCLFYLYVVRILALPDKYLHILIKNLVREDGIDLTFRFDENDTSTPQSCLAMNASLTTIESMFEELYISASRLLPMANELRDTYASMTQKATIQHTHGQDLAQTIGQTITTSGELGVNVDKIYNCVSNVTESVKKTRLDSDKSQTSLITLANNIEQTGVHIKQLKQDSDDIGSIIEVINSIAEQTNLLALNAAIEAARAGEQGRGFAVVADEVRHLAARTSKSTQEVSAMVTKIQQSTDLTHSLMNTALNEVQQTVTLTKTTSKEINTIETAILEVSEMSSLINQQVSHQQHLSDESQTYIESLEQLNSDALSSSKIQSVSSEDLRRLAKSLEQKLNFFKVAYRETDQTLRTDPSRIHIDIDSEPSADEHSTEVELF